MANPELFNYTVDVFQAEALAWLEQHAAPQSLEANNKTPFFLYLSFTVPHAGGWGDEKESGQPVPTDLQVWSQGGGGGG